MENPKALSDLIPQPLCFRHLPALAPHSPEVFVLPLSFSFNKFPLKTSQATSCLTFNPHPHDRWPSLLDGYNLVEFSYLSAFSSAASLHPRGPCEHMAPGLSDLPLSLQPLDHMAHSRCFSELAHLGSGVTTPILQDHCQNHKCFCTQPKSQPADPGSVYSHSTDDERKDGIYRASPAGPCPGCGLSETRLAQVPAPGRRSAMSEWS